MAYKWGLLPPSKGSQQGEGGFAPSQVVDDFFRGAVFSPLQKTPGEKIQSLNRNVPCGASEFFEFLCEP